jgi:hypothetical protein
MRHLLLCILLLSGCAPYTQVQIQLVEQTRRGLKQVESSLESKSQIVREYHELQRKRLDDAFDADVRQHDPLDPDWVIEHRRAYAAAIDALHSATIASLEADESNHRTIEAMRAALDRLEYLQALQLRIISRGEEP